VKFRMRGRIKEDLMVKMSVLMADMLRR